MPTRSTLRGVLYEELEGSPTFRANDGGLTAIQKWKLEWDQIDALLEEAFPTKLPIGNKIDHVLGLLFPGKDWLAATNIAIAPLKGAVPVWDASVGRNKYVDGGAVATITYTHREGELPEPGTDENDPNDTNIVIASREVTIGGEFLVMPNQGLKVETVPGTFETIQNEDVRAGKLIPTVEHTLTMHRVPEIPFNSIVTIVGKVNEFQALFDAPIETLLFLGARARRDRTTRGDTMWELEYRWSQRIIATEDDIDGDGLGEWATWNHYWIPDVGKWLRVWTKDDKRIYPLTSFAPLFQPDIPTLEPGIAGIPQP